MADQPINADSELKEAYNKYVSDSSSNSQISLRREKHPLRKLIDKMDSLDSDSVFSVFGSKLYEDVNETIEEELSDLSDQL